MKGRLVSVATELLSQPKSIKLPTMRDIATAAGVSVGAAYRHFGSQEELFFAVVEELFADLEKAIDQAVNSAKNRRDKIGSAATAYVVWGVSNPGGYQLLFETTDDPELLEHGLRPGLHLIEKIASLIGGAKTPSANDQERLFRLWASLHGLVSLRNHKLGMVWTNSLTEEVRAILGSTLRR